MTKCSWLANVAKRLGFKKVTRQVAYAGAAAVLAGGLFFAGQSRADVISFDDLEGLNLVAFTAASGFIDLGQGGTDWTRDVRTGTNREWTIDNSLMANQTKAPAYDGWAAWNVDSWIAEQGTQLGRGTGIASGGNTALVADPDAWDDFVNGATPLGYNSYFQREYDLTGFDQNSMEISFDYEFASYDSQRGTVEVSFDGGTTWDLILDLDSDVLGNSVLTTGPATFNAGIDFTPTSQSMIFRVGCLDADNDWWFAIDNISVTTGDGFSDVEDFEGLSLEQHFVSVGDGTDWTRDIPNWTVDNSLSLAGSTEAAYDGWAAMDVASWTEEQGGQGRSLFGLVDPNNTALVADGDAFYDYDFDLSDPSMEGPADSYNTYITRSFDVSGYDNCTLLFSFEYEFRIENQQLGTVEVSFDNGTTWTRIVEWDDNDGANGDTLAGLAQLAAGVDFQARQTNNVLFRFGYLNAGNNWWFAVDSIQLEGDTIAFVKGDASGDGNLNTLDLAPFVGSVLAQTYDPAIDMNCDGSVNTLDIAGFIGVLLNGY